MVTDGGTALVDGIADVPPTLDLRIDGGAGVTAATVRATLDGGQLPLRDTGTTVSAATAAMPLGSAHVLVLDLPGRSPQTISFHVVSPGEAFAAVHQEAGRAVVLDLVFSLAPLDPGAVTAALPAGGAPSWSDATHLRASWAAAPAGSHLRLPASMATARGSQLGGALDADLGSSPPAGTLRSASAPAVPTAAAPALAVLAFTTSTAASRASLEAHAGQISVVSPTGLTAGADGGVGGSPDAAAVTIAARHGIPVVPLIQNKDFSSAAVHALLTTPGAVAALVATLRRRAADGGWAGVHLDFENVPETDRDALSALVASLAAGLHADARRLDVAVVPHRPGHLNAINAAYDLAAIGRSADRVTLMAYEEHSPSSDPGPVAGLAWDGQVLDGSLDEVGPAARSLLGIPLYARTWADGGDSADSYSASVRDALAAADGARVDYDFIEGTPTIAPLAGGRPVTWFDDAASLRRKVDLAVARHLAGIAMWRLGFEDPAVWSQLPAVAVAAAG